MSLYILKFSTCLALLLAVYYLFLEREKMHHFNRFYLLGSVLFSLLVPHYILYIQPETSSAFEAPISITTITTTEATFQWSKVFLYGYIAITSLFLIRFCKNIVDISLKIKRSTHIKTTNATLVLVEESILPHTFLNYIFIHKEAYEHQTIEEELLTHELAHVLQKHTLDILSIELIKALLWINPFMFLLKKAIQLNHEFLADEHVVTSHHDIPRYQYLLLDKAAWNNTYYLASNLNYSLTKKRLKMMKTTYSTKTQWIKKIALVPLLAVLVFVFATRVEAQRKKNTEIIEVVVDKPITDAELKEYKGIIAKAEKEQLFTFKEVKRLRYLYDRMSVAQQKSVKNVYTLIPPPPPPLKRVKETKPAKGPKVAKKANIKVRELSPKSKKGKTIIVEEIEEVDTPKVIEIVELPRGEVIKVKELEEDPKMRQNVTEDIDRLPWLPSFFIFLLFLAIETSPIFAKLVASKGPYDFKLEDEETAVKTWVEQQVQQRKEMLQADININRKVYTDLQEDQEVYDYKRSKGSALLQAQADAFFKKQQQLL